MQEHSWSWRNHRISYVRVSAPTNGSPPGRAIVCVHGFGASKGHWRHNLEALSSDDEGCDEGDAFDALVSESFAEAAAVAIRATTIVKISFIK